MQIVIEIPEATYEMIKEMQKRNGTEYMNELESGVANGTPLPKGHGNLKDVGKLPYHCMYENNADCDHKNCNICQFMCVAKYEMEDIPTIIEADKETDDYYRGAQEEY